MKSLNKIFICITGIFTILTAVFLYESGVSFAQSAGPVRAGISKIDVTPEIPVTMSGYSSRKALSEGIHDHLFARITAFESDGNRVVFVASDLIGFYSGTYDFMMEGITGELGLKPNEIFLTGTHTHSGPSLTVNPERGHENNVKYTKSLRPKLIKGIREAMDDMRPVTIGTGRGYASVGMNRREMNPDGTMRIGRNPYGPQDKEVLVLRVDNPDGSAVGALFDYATHATSLGPRNMLISGDVLGIASGFAEKIIGNGLIVPAFAGASGDVDPWYRVLPGFNTEPGWIPETVLLGTLLGEEVVRVYRDIEELKSEAAVGSAIKTVMVPGKKRGEVQARQDNLGPDKQEKVAANVTAARVGDVAFVGINAEVLTEVGWAIKKGSPYKYTFIITHCNGSSGYLPPAHLYKEGGYEIRSSPYSPQAADMIVKEALKLVYSL